MDNEKVTAQVVVQSYDTMNKNKRVYSLNDVQEAIRKHQSSSMYGIFGEYGTFDKSKEIKVSRLEDLDECNGFKPGYLYCFKRQLEGSLCEKCESKEQCIKDKKDEVDRIKNIISDAVDSFDISKINMINELSIPIDVISSMVRRKEKDGD